MTDPYEQVESEQEEQTEQVDQYLSDIRWMILHEPGRRLLYKWLQASGVFQTSFSSDASIRAFSEGRREFGLQLMGDAQEASPENFIEMLQEQINGRRADD